MCVHVRQRGHCTDIYTSKKCFTHLCEIAIDRGANALNVLELAARTNMGTRPPPPMPRPQPTELKQPPQPSQQSPEKSSKDPSNEGSPSVAPTPDPSPSPTASPPLEPTPSPTPGPAAEVDNTAVGHDIVNPTDRSPSHATIEQADAVADYECSDDDTLI